MTAGDAPTLPAGPAPFTAGRMLALTALCAAGWAVVAGLCCLVGFEGVGWPRPEILDLRLNRLVPASLVGVGLSVAGVALQSLLRNPLASPDILGISSGAAVGAGLAMVAGAAGALAPLSRTAAAGLGGVLTILIVYLVAQRRGRLDPYTLLLTGVVISTFNGAIVMFLYVIASSAVQRDMMAWAMGQIPEQATLPAIASSGAVILAGWVVLAGRAKAFNVQALGDDVAGASGVNVQALRLTTFAAAALVTAATVALAGPIAFLGLIVPHVSRRLFGPDHRILLVTSGFIGGAFLAAADTLVRWFAHFQTGELPVGIVTALCGGPFFIGLLRRRFKEGR